MKKKKSGIRKEYKKCFKFIKESRKFIFLIIALFIFSLLVGFFMPIPDFLSQIIKNFLNELVKETQSLSTAQLIGFIFSNNVQVSFLGMIFGFLFGIIPVVFSLMNGYILGFVISISVQNEGILSIWKLFPHGIFELPAVFISLGIGLRLGMSIFNKKEKLKELFWDSIRVFLLVVIPLLLIAGIIEGVLISITG